MGCVGLEVPTPGPSFFHKLLGQILKRGVNGSSGVGDGKLNHLVLGSSIRGSRCRRCRRFNGCGVRSRFSRRRGRASSFVGPPSLASWIVIASWIVSMLAAIDEAAIVFVRFWRTPLRSRLGAGIFVTTARVTTAIHASLETLKFFIVVLLQASFDACRVLRLRAFLVRMWAATVEASGGPFRIMASIEGRLAA